MTEPIFHHDDESLGSEGLCFMTKFRADRLLFLAAVPVPFSKIGPAGCRPPGIHSTSSPRRSVKWWSTFRAPDFA